MDVFKNIVEYVAIIMSAIILIKRSNYILKYYQQSHYRLSSFKKIIKHYYFGKWQYLIWVVLLFIIFLDKWYLQLVYIVYIIVSLIIYSRKKDILKLKQTMRIYRNYFVILVLGTIISSGLLFLLQLPELISSLAVILFILPLLIFASSVIVLPIEKLIGLHYQSKAKRKLKAINPDIIGITGSFGKTSTKNILFEFLKEKKITLATRKSYNTLNGVCISINDDLTKNAEVMIVEMGASQVGDISSLVKLVKPKYAVLTGITAQHLETFKTIENIIDEKMRLIAALDSEGIGFINGDDELIQNYHINSKAKIKTFGLSPKCDYYASEIQVDARGMKFNINFDKTFIKVQTKLLGKHNIYNILAAFSVAVEYGVRYSVLKNIISTLEPVAHRLKIEKSADITIIDDSFNSNKIGFASALEVLSHFEKPRILITPGIVEAGSMEEEINYNLASKIKEVVDEVVLIKTRASIHILGGLKEIGFGNIKIVDNFRDAKKYVFDKYQKASVLIENDVSDIYKI